MMFFSAVLPSSVQESIVNAPAAERMRLNNRYIENMNNIDQWCLAKTIQAYLALKEKYAADHTMDWFVQSIMLDIQYFNQTRIYKMLDRAAIFQHSTINAEKQEFDAIQESAKESMDELTYQFTTDYKLACPIGHTVECVSWSLAVGLFLFACNDNTGQSIAVMFVALYWSSHFSEYRSNQTRLHAEKIAPKTPILDNERLIAQLEGREALMALAASTVPIVVAAPIVTTPTMVQPGAASAESMPLIMAMNNV